MNHTLRLGSIGGIAIRVHPSWLIIFFLITWSLAVAYLPAENPLNRPLTNWLLGGLAALLLFASVLLHELSHSFVAKSKGMTVHAITLFVFGGASELEGDPPHPSAEFLIAAAGPAASFVLAGFFWSLDLAIGNTSTALASVLGYLAWINLVLAIFNLVPGFPLDGGRVLRSVIWQFTGSLRRATQIAAGSGMLIGYLFVMLGVFQVIAGNILGGVWIALIGWFLAGAASGSLRQQTLHDQFAGVRVADIMRVDPVTIGPATSVHDLVENYLLARNLRAVPVTEDGRLVGMVTLGDIRKADRGLWESTAVAEIMGGRDGLTAVAPDDTLVVALEHMAVGDFDRLPVVEDGRLVGILSRSEMLRRLQVRSAVDDGRKTA